MKGLCIIVVVIMVGFFFFFFGVCFVTFICYLFGWSAFWYSNLVRISLDVVWILFHMDFYAMGGGSQEKEGGVCFFFCLSVFPFSMVSSKN